jgi:ArsR family transcriptional regulator, arsenate/arsenite/antimonite-responsive transcriptional repressor
MRDLHFCQYFDIIRNMEIKDAVSSLAALAQDSRLAIFRLLVEAGPSGLAVGVIAESLEIRAATLSFHLKELARADLISARQDGRFIYYSANFPQMAALLVYLTDNCCRGMPQECLGVMETALAQCCAPKPKSKSKRSCV